MGLTFVSYRKMVDMISDATCVFSILHLQVLFEVTLVRNDPLREIGMIHKCPVGQ